jgi:hypothetical protein
MYPKTPFQSDLLNVWNAETHSNVHYRSHLLLKVANLGIDFMNHLLEKFGANLQSIKMPHMKLELSSHPACNIGLLAFIRRY